MPQNDAEALKWFRKAADQGETRAQASLGLMYQGRNSPFTVQLLRELGSPERDIEVALKAVRAGVQQTTKGQQIPWSRLR